METREQRAQLVISENLEWNEDTFNAFEKEAEFLSTKVVNLVEAFRSRIDVKVISDVDLANLKAYLDHYKIVIDNEVSRRG